MDYTTANQNIKQIYLDCQNGLYKKIKLLQDQFNSMSYNQIYCVSVSSCSALNMGKIFQIISQKISINQNLMSLCFWNCGIKEDLLCQLNKQKQPLLEQLSIIDCPISGKLLFNLDRNLGWHNLKSLQFGSKEVDQQQACLGMSNICQYNLPNLKILRIHNFKMSKKCVLNFLKSNWNNLEELYLFSCNLENESMRVLSKCNWKSLEKLSLFHNQIGIEGTDYLTCSNWMELNKIGFYYKYETDPQRTNLLKFPQLKEIIQFVVPDFF